MAQAPQSCARAAARPSAPLLPMLALPMLVLAAALLALPALADERPPAGALPLSQILLQIEATGDVAAFDEVEWDDDGYWDIAYHRTGGGAVEIKVDPVTGERRG